MGCGGSKAASTKEAEQAPVQGEDAAKTLLDSAPAKPSADASASLEPESGSALALKVPIKVTIVSARDLRNADFVLAGKSDPYCMLEITGKPDTKITTANVNDELSPVWNHECEELTYTVGDSLTFTVKDKDPIKPDDFLGKVLLKPEQFFPNGFDGEVELVEAGEGVKAFLKVKVSVVHPKVRVIMTSASNLRNADWVGKSDPYCICEVQGKPDTKLQTGSVAESLNPEWKHEAELSGYQLPDTLTFTVKDQDPLKPDDILGKVELQYEKFSSGFDGELALSETNGVASMLKVRVEVGKRQDAAEEPAAAPEATAAIAVEEASADETAQQKGTEKVAEAAALVEGVDTTDVQPVADDVVVEGQSAAKTCFC